MCSSAGAFQELLASFLVGWHPDCDRALTRAHTRLPSSLSPHRSRFYLTCRLRNTAGLPQAYGSSSTSVMSGPLACRAAGRRKRFCMTTWASSSGLASLLSTSLSSPPLLSS